MADKNLHDIKIDELDSPKKTPLKNILTLLALLFIILVISVVITRLILGTDGSKEVEESATPAGLATEVQADKNESLATNLTDGTKATLAAATAATTAVVASGAKKVPVISNILERNNSSRTKTPLRTHEPVKPVKEVKKLVTTTPKTYKTPKHTSSSKHTTVTKKHTSSTKHASTPKKEYADKIVVKKHTTKKYVSKKSSTTHSANYLGGKKKKLTRSYYIQVGSYKKTKTILSKIRRQNFNYSLQSVDGKKDLTRVFVGPFISQSQAEKNLSKVKAHVLKGAYVKKVIP